jgi:ribonuclease BN (tRNA processing enzyme)
MHVPARGRSPRGQDKEWRDAEKHLLDSHTTTEDVSRIAAAADVRVLVMTHFIPGDDRITDDNWTEDVKNFAGKIVVAKDLMELKLPV